MTQLTRLGLVRPIVARFVETLVAVQVSTGSKRPDLSDLGERLDR